MSSLQFSYVVVLCFQCRFHLNLNLNKLTSNISFFLLLKIILQFSWSTRNWIYLAQKNKGGVLYLAMFRVQCRVSVVTDSHKLSFPLIHHAGCPTKEWQVPTGSFTAHRLSFPTLSGCWTPSTEVVGANVLWFESKRVWTHNLPCNMRVLQPLIYMCGFKVSALSAELSYGAQSEAESFTFN